MMKSTWIILPIILSIVCSHAFGQPKESESRVAEAYNNRGNAYYLKGDYDKSWEDIKKAQDLGYKISSKFLEDLHKASGKQN